MQTAQQDKVAAIKILKPRIYVSKDLEDMHNNYISFALMYPLKMTYPVHLQKLHSWGIKGSHS